MAANPRVVMHSGTFIKRLPGIRVLKMGLLKLNKGFAVVQGRDGGPSCRFRDVIWQ